MHFLRAGRASLRLHPPHAKLVRNLGRGVFVLSAQQFIHLQAGAGLSPAYSHRNRYRPRAHAPQPPGRPKVFAGLVAARRIRMGILPRKSEVVHVKLTLDQALEQLRLQYVRAAARI
jgi:hypothetical protein